MLVIRCQIKRSRFESKIIGFSLSDYHDKVQDYDDEVQDYGGEVLVGSDELGLDE